ncbi:MAG: serine/threonine protein phosphatase [Thermoproteota archaeon]|nr:serine/threonine protein phosphatase [Thermoproteota archaeon]
MQLARQAKAADGTELIQKISQALCTFQGCNQMRSPGGSSRIGADLVKIHDLENLVVVSDLHGDSNSLFQILSEINYKRFLAKKLNKLVFLGDYIDRGGDSLSIIYAICHLKTNYPDSVILMRGNHEAPAEFPFSPHDYPYRLRERFGERWREIYRQTLSLFRMLPILTIVRQKLLLVHGGLPTQKTSAGMLADAFASDNENLLKSNSMLEELLWNDPRDLPEDKPYERSRRGLGRYFGRSVTHTWLQKTGTKVIIRGHEPCRGFKLDHDNKIMTLFSCRGIYPNSAAAYLVLDRTDIDTAEDAADLLAHIKLLM